MPLWDFKCQRCGAIKEVSAPSLAHVEEHSVWCDSPDCKPAIPGGVCRMVRQVSAPNFTVKGFNADNGYSFSDD